MKENSEWLFSELGKCCEIPGEYGINAASVPYSKQLPTYLRITDIDAEGNLLKDSLTSVDNPDSRHFLLSDGDVVFARTGATVGKTYLHKAENGSLVFAGFLIRFRPNPKILDSYFLKLFTETKEYNDWLKINSTRSGQPGVNGKELATLVIPLPPLPEQKKIAAILSTWDKAIDAQTKLIAAKEKQKKALMQKLLSGEVRFKGFEDEWREVKLGDIIEICSSKRVLEKDWKLSGVPFYRTREIISLSNDQEFRTPIFISEELFKELKQKYGVPKAGDILVTGVGTIGETYVVKASDKFYFKDGNVLWFRMNENLNSHFLNHLFKTGFIIKQLSDNATITTVATFTIEGARATRIKLPSVDEQHAIANVLHLADDEIKKLRRELKAILLQKKGLLQNLLTGKIRVKT